MSSQEMKNKLFDKIQLTDDDNILEEVYRILDVSTQEVDMFILSDDQTASIDEGLRDYEEGRFLTNDEANREIEEWLKK